MTSLTIFSVVAGFYQELFSDSFSDPSGDLRPLDGAGGECDTCTPTPCDARCKVQDWLEHVNYNKHIKQNRVCQLSCDDLNHCTAAALSWRWTPLSFSEDGFTCYARTETRNVEDAKLSGMLRWRLCVLTKAYESDLCEFTVQCCPLDPHR